MCPDHLIRVFNVGICWLVSGILPCPDCILGATDSTAVAVPPDGELTAKGKLEHLCAVEREGFFPLLDGIHVLVVEPVMGRDLVQVIAEAPDVDGVAPYKRSVAPPEPALVARLEVVNREGRHDGRSIYLLSFPSVTIYYHIPGHMSTLF